jgi:hypothetical protein
MALWTDKGLVSPATWQDADAMTLNFGSMPVQLSFVIGCSGVF